jgi:hypothetical protein
MFLCRKPVIFSGTIADIERHCQSKHHQGARLRANQAAAQGPEEVVSRVRDTLLEVCLEGRPFWSLKSPLTKNLICCPRALSVQAGCRLLWEAAAALGVVLREQIALSPVVNLRVDDVSMPHTLGGRRASTSLTSCSRRILMGSGQSRPILRDRLLEIHRLDCEKVTGDELAMVIDATVLVWGFETKLFQIFWMLIRTPSRQMLTSAMATLGWTWRAQCNRRAGIRLTRAAFYEVKAAFASLSLDFSMTFSL